MYLNKSFHATPISNMGATGAQGTLNELPLTATGVLARFLVAEDCQIDQVGFCVTTSMSATAAPVVSFNYAAYPGSTTGSGVVATVTIATGAVAGGTNALTGATATGGLFINKCKPVSLKAGNELTINCTALASSAGKGVAFFRMIDMPEDNRNVLSTLVVTG
jgi:hypothetical protein